MKVKKISILLMLVLSLFLVACNKNEKTYAVATFYLDGGTSKNKEYEKLNFKYEIKEGETTYILDPTDPVKNKDNQIIKFEYTLEGWYRTKTGEGVDAVYSDPWDFTTDKMGSEGVVLYAKWRKNVSYTFSLVTNFSGEEKVIDTLQVNENDQITKRYLDGKAKNYGKTIKSTIIGYEDENGNPWDFSYKHPGGSVDTDIKIYAKYIKGEYELVSTYMDLILASGNIYLLNDIDCEGQELSFENFKGLNFEGNGHKISNFTINSDLPQNGEESLDGDGTITNAYIALFGDISGAEIKNVTFENAHIDLNYPIEFTKITHIYFNSFASLSDDNTVIENVTITGDYYLNPANKIACEIVDRAIYKSTKSYDTLVCNFNVIVEE